MLLSAQLQSRLSVLQECIWLVINHHDMLDQCKVDAVSLLMVPAVKPTSLLQQSTITTNDFSLFLVLILESGCIQHTISLSALQRCLLTEVTTPRLLSSGRSRSSHINQQQT